MIIDPKLIDVELPFAGLDGGDSENELLSTGNAVKPFPAKYRIDKSEWRDRIHEQEKHNASAERFSARLFDQGDSHECVYHQLCQGMEIARNRQMGGTDHAVYLSPLAGYTRATGGRRYGGSNVRDSLTLAIEEGMLPEFDGPGGDNEQYKKFKHTVQQTSGRDEDHWPTTGFITPRRLPEGYEKTARHFRVLEAYTIGDEVDHISSLLRGWAVGNGRSGHSILHARAVISDRDKILSRYLDSYKIARYDSLRMLGGGYCIRSVTMPDDPTQPVGEQVK